jgi:hypothetical protein
MKKEGENDITLSLLFSHLLFCISVFLKEYKKEKKKGKKKRRNGNNSDDSFSQGQALKNKQGGDCYAGSRSLLTVVLLSNLNVG